MSPDRIPGPIDPIGAERSGDIIALLWPMTPELRRFLRTKVPDHDVDDVMQEVFARVMRRGAGPIEHPRNYLYRTARAALIDRYRKRQTRSATQHCELDEVRLPHDELTPDRFILARERLRRLQSVLNQMPDRTKRILIAVRVEGSSLKSVADDLGISISAVEKHLARARYAADMAEKRDESVDILD